MRIQITLRLVLAMVASICIGAALLSQDARGTFVVYTILSMPFLLRLLFDGIVNRMVASVVSTWIPISLFAMAIMQALNVEGNQIYAEDISRALLIGLAAGLFSALISGIIDGCVILFQRPILRRSHSRPP